ncbi:MAG: hypothetical protein FWC22_02605 [Treponema sp.]|nr:hypothetical protein [Treponema sp.]
MEIDSSFKRKDVREASDTGLMLWRQNFSTFLLLFALPFWITAFLIRIVTPENFNYLSWLCIWLLKPLFDRIILHIISVRFFESGANLKRVCLGLGKSLRRGLAGDLLWRRFSPVRSAVMPVRVLELNINTRKRFAQRKKNLEKGGIGYCFFLTVWGIVLDGVLLSGVIVFILTMGELISSDFFYSLNGLGDLEIYIFAVWCVNYMLIESIYVCMGFSLYINSRIEVEGWDIEIRFKDIAKKFADKTKNGIMFVLLLAFLIMPAKTHAQESPDIDVPYETLQNILSSPDFGGEEDAWGIQFKRKPVEREYKENNSVSLKRLQEIFSHSLRIILIGIIAGFLVFLFLYIRRNYWKGTGGAKKPAEMILPALIAEDPELLLEKALVFYDKGETRLAWGYCTAAAILSWQVYKGIAFPNNATESDCAQIVKAKSAGNAADEFNKLIKHWIYFAYAGRLPPEGSFKEAADLCVSLRTDNG